MDPGHQEDVVVDPERDEEYEDQQRQAGVRTLEPEELEQERTESERGKERQHHGGDEDERRDHGPQQERQDEEHHDQHDRE